MRFPLVKHFKESRHRPLIVGWLGLLAITLLIFSQFQELSELAESTFGSVPSGSIGSTLFGGIFPHTLAAVVIVSLIGMVTIQGPVWLKLLMLGITMIGLVATEYHWPANWATENELRVLASLMFMFLVVATGMSVVAMGTRVFCGWHFAVGNELEPQMKTLGRRVSLSELIALTGLTACTIAIGRQTHFSPTEVLEWCVGSVAYSLVLSIRLWSLAESSAIRWWGRVLGVLFFAVLQIAEVLWPFDKMPEISLTGWFGSGLAAFAGAIVYWFMTMLPILWMKVNDWRIVSSSSTRSTETDVDRISR